MNATNKPETLEQAEARTLGLTVPELRELRRGRSRLSVCELRQRQIIAADWNVKLADETMKLNPTRLHAENLREARQELKQLQHS